MSAAARGAWTALWHRARLHHVTTSHHPLSSSWSCNCGAEWRSR